MGIRRAAVVVALVAGSLGGSPARADGPKCFGRDATIVGGTKRLIRGTPGDDVITGYERDHVVEALAGDDLVCTDGISDRIDAGPGNDRVRVAADPGAARIDAGPGNDYVSAGYGWIAGGPGDDVLRGIRLDGGFGDDVLTGVDRGQLRFRSSPAPITLDLARGVARGWGDDRVRGEIAWVVGSPHDDVLRGDVETNKLWGMAGDDVLVGRGANDYLKGDSKGRRLTGDDVIYGGGRRDRMMGGRGNDRLYAGTENDYLFPGEGDDVAYGGPGGDAIYEVGTGSDALYGDEGRDHVDYYKEGSVALDVDLGAGRVEGTDVDELFDVESAYGGRADDTIRGTDDANVLGGNGGGDALYGLGGDDLLLGADGFDTGDGGDGQDRCDGVEAPIACEEVQPAPDLSKARGREAYVTTTPAIQAAIISTPATSSARIPRPTALRTSTVERLASRPGPRRRASAR